MYSVVIDTKVYVDQLIVRT